MPYLIHSQPQDKKKGKGEEGRDLIKISHPWLISSPPIILKQSSFTWVGARWGWPIAAARQQTEYTYLCNSWKPFSYLYSITRQSQLARYSWQILANRNPTPCLICTWGFEECEECGVASEKRWETREMLECDLLIEYYVVSICRLAVI